ncbi:carboxypeptidase inhibitor SmCI-like isoform X2 [Eucyclogobius newberryi]|uniref:carboxypeptidase inhibitor SmCI-like isoform X2 n=1 Tax=Eucyclogobius newberryi TaxID=166745 RepID=UPI003B593B4D
MAALHKCLLLRALLCAACAACGESRRSHRNGGGFESERFIFREQCALKAEPGSCKAIKLRFFFNIDSGRCETFEFGGCGGNDNNFMSREECEEMCVVSEDKDPCQLPEAPGPCRGLVSRFLFDHEVQSCRHFFYGGCFGNANNFRTMNECKTRCQSKEKPDLTTPSPHIDLQDVHTRAAVRRMVLDSAHVTEAMVAAQAEALLQPDNKTKHHHTKDEECGLGLDRGDCDGAERRFFYNSTTRRCQSFTFSGCGGNKNNFNLRRVCVKKCVLRHRDHRGMMGDKIRIRRKNLDKFRLVSI